MVASKYHKCSFEEMKEILRFCCEHKIVDFKIKFENCGKIMKYWKTTHISKIFSFECVLYFNIKFHYSNLSLDSLFKILDEHKKDIPKENITYKCNEWSHVNIKPVKRQG